MKELDFSIEEAKKLKPDSIILMGDFNAKHSSWFNQGTTDTCGTLLLDTLESNNLHQLIDSPTHIDNFGNNALLDLLITDSPNLFTLHGPGLPLSNCDHSPVIGQLFIGKQQSKSYQRRLWFYDQIDQENFHQIFSSIPWNTCFDLFDDPSDTYDCWNKFLSDALEEAIPNKLVRIFPGNQPWFKKEHYFLRRRVHRFFKRAARTQRDFDWNNYRRLKNEYTTLCNNSKKHHEEKLHQIILRGEVSSRVWWKITKQLVGKKACSFIPPLIVNNKVMTDDIDKANALNNYFTRVTKVDDSQASIPKLDIPPIETLSDIQCTPEEVIKYITDLNVNKSCGYDGISVKMLKLACPYIAESLSKIINICFFAGIQPTSLKYVNVMPLFKSDDKHSPSNYRPISLLSIINKVFEKIVFNRVQHFLERHDFFTEAQSGFRKNDSTTNQLIDIVHTITQSFDKNEETIAISLDISKAFDKVWHKGLLFKLRRAGISGNLLKWFENYLKGRKQRVCINGFYSVWKLIEAGVPQGSILGPLLFLIYINDITVDIKCLIKLFADDTFLYHATKDIPKGIKLINADLDRISRWAKQWLVSMNAKKTKAILFSDKKHKSTLLGIKMQGTTIVTQSHIKHLGIILDSNLTWSEHIVYITTRANRMSASLSLLSAKLPSKTLLIAYKSYVRPILEYADVVWGGCGIKLQSKLEQVQYRSMIAISGAIRTTSSDRIRNFLGLAKLSDRRNIHRITLLYKITRNQTPIYLLRILNQYLNPALRYTRNRQEYIVPRGKNRKFINSFFPAAISSWTKLNVTIRNSQTTAKTFQLTLFREFKCPLSNSCVYFLGKRQNEKHLNRFVLMFSSLHADLFTHNLVDSPYCSCGKLETRGHFLFECQKFQLQRNSLIQNLKATSIFANFDFESKTPKHTLKILENSLNFPNPARISIARSIQYFFDSTDRF